MADISVIVDLTITEYADGKVRNRCVLRREGAGSYLSTAERVMRALAAAEELTADTEATP
ncbi:MAG TPA: hypothetical protein VK611_24840 [Acidimicrobiales bacterium]|nr:hypothetical protein [Acidimicrobiales bacterium]